MHQCLGHNRDARSTIDARRRTYNDSREGAKRGYHPRCGGCYDSGEDRSPSLACRALRPSAGTSSMLLSHQGTDRLKTSLNILGKQTPSFGSKTISSHVKPVARIMMTSLSATFHCSCPIQHKHGWNTCRLTQSRVGRIGRRSLWETSRALTSALGTHGTSRTAVRRPVRPSMGTSGASPDSATSSPTSPMPT